MEPANGLDRSHNPEPQLTDFAATRAQFHLPDRVVYLDGNSLGPLPKTATDRVAQVMRDEWGELLITGWNRAGWMEMPRRVGDRIGRLIGAPEGSVVMGDTLSVKVYQALAAAIEMRPDRRVILSDSGNFPSDLYMALEVALDVWDGIDLADIRARSIELSERFLAGVEAACPDLKLASPRDPKARGSQVSFRFADGYAAMQALIANGVIGDFRAPDIMRFGITPLYLNETDIDQAVATLSRIMENRLWDTPVFKKRAAVT